MIIYYTYIFLYIISENMARKLVHNSKEYIQVHNIVFLNIEYKSYTSRYIYQGYLSKYIELYTQGWRDDTRVF